jgi:hypothetical protein
VGFVSSFRPPSNCVKEVLFFAKALLEVTVTGTASGFSFSFIG